MSRFEFNIAEGNMTGNCYELNPLPVATRPLDSLRVFCILALYLKIQFELAVDMNRRSSSTGISFCPVIL